MFRRRPIVINTSACMHAATATATATERHALKNSNRERGERKKKLVSYAAYSLTDWPTRNDQNNSIIAVEAAAAAGRSVANDPPTRLSLESPAGCSLVLFAFPSQGQACRRRRRANDVPAAIFIMSARRTFLTPAPRFRHRLVSGRHAHSLAQGGPASRSESASPETRLSFVVVVVRKSNSISSLNTK